MTSRQVAGCWALLILAGAGTGLPVARGQDEPQEMAVPTLEPAGVLQGHDKTVHGVAFSPDGKRIVSAGEDEAIVWDAVSGKMIRRLDTGDDNPVPAYSVAFAPDGKTIAIGGYSGDVFLWDAEGKPAGKLDEPSLAVLCLAYSPDGSILAASHDQAEIMLFDAKTRKLLGTIKPTKGAIKSFAFSSDGKTIAGITNELLATWDVESRALRKSLPLPKTGMEWSYSSLACSPKSPVVVASGGQLLNQKTVAYDLKSLKAKGGLVTEQYEPTINILRFSPDGKLLASGGSGAADHTPVTLWDAASGQRLAELVGSTENLSAIAFAADGRRVAAVGFDKAVRVWEIPGQGAAAPKAKTKKGRR